MKFYEKAWLLLQLHRRRVRKLQPAVPVCNLLSVPLRDHMKTQTFASYIAKTFSNQHDCKTFLLERTTCKGCQRVQGLTLNESAQMQSNAGVTWPKGLFL